MSTKTLGLGDSVTEISDSNQSQRDTSRSGPHLAAAQQEALRVVARAVPSRVLLKAMAEVRSKMALICVPLLFELLAYHLASRPASEVVTNRNAAYAVIHLALRLRSELAAASNPEAASEQTAAAAEESGGVALMRLTACLNESQLRPFLIRAFTFASTTPTNQSTKHKRNRDYRSLRDCKVVAHRVLSLFQLVVQSQAHFAALYGPVFALGLPLAVRTIATLRTAQLLPRIVQGLSIANEGLLGRRTSTKAQPAQIESDTPEVTSAALIATLRFITNGLRHHSSAPFAAVEALQAPLALLLVASAAATRIIAQKTAAVTSPAEKASDATIALEAAALEAVHALAASAEPDSIRVLHRSLCAEVRAKDPAAQLTRLLRSETTEVVLLHEIAAAARRSALSGLLVMYETLREGALIFDDAIPIASEAMEDSDPAVRQVALRITRELDKVSERS